MQIKRVGVIGLGNMGLPMAAMLPRKGVEVSGFDLSKQRQALAADQGIGAVARLVDLLRDAVVPSLPHACDVETALTTPDALLARRRRLAKLLGEAGHGHLDAPASGGAVAVEALAGTSAKRPKRPARQPGQHGGRRTERHELPDHLGLCHCPRPKLAEQPPVL